MIYLFFFLNSDIDVKSFKGDKGKLLLSSFFPGVSRDPKGLVNWINSPDPEDRDELYKHPGMGLTTLINAAVDLMGGQVSVRTSNYFLNIKTPTDPTPLNEYKKLSADNKYNQFYQAKITRLNPESNLFDGNMLTVRIPLQASHESPLSY